jgi:hypothetical protein
MDLASRRRCAAFRLGARRACVWWWQTIHPSFSTSTEEARSLSPAFPVMKRGVLSVVGVAGRAAVVVAESAPDAKLYAVRGRGARVSSLGTGRNVWPVSDGRSVWVQSVVDRSRCALRQVGLDRRKDQRPPGVPLRHEIGPRRGLAGTGREPNPRARPAHRSHGSQDTLGDPGRSWRTRLARRAGQALHADRRGNPLPAAAALAQHSDRARPARRRPARPLCRGGICRSSLERRSRLSTCGCSTPRQGG